ncbi:flavin monoamine oxidase family protein [Nonlabens marinus]|uniref:Amine oxidase, flavin-containing n=1 Tax=Nonlabens marinus S1-08 TaxID=1454201 RepID=W8W0C4_9FLAO|nr:NAD(P)/FAD-dependent oxidoreductase [Nonlabens marinus]BAO56081.1 amine oxidase, flavin-containing [Nonlabens marinus S1-08]
MHAKITILGGGLTGVYLGYLLQLKGMDYQILEGRSRLGGRIFTKMSGNHVPIDLGAAWFWDYNPKLKQLLEDLNILTHPQSMGPKVWYQPTANASYQQFQLPPQEQISYRIKGGATNLILSLASTLDAEKIHLDTMVNRVTREEKGYKLQTSQGIFTTEKVICALPPAILNARISFDPELPNDYQQIASKTHTWMENSIKFGIGFPKAFWKYEQIPVTSFSNYGPITELYDYSNADQDRFAMMGFLHPEANTWTPEDRKAKVMQQLETIFGTRVLDYISYEEIVWQEQEFTHVASNNSLTPHQNNGHSLLRQTFHENSLIMAGSETSAVLPGYMEGALHSAQTAFDLLK